MSLLTCSEVSFLHNVTILDKPINVIAQDYHYKFPPYWPNLSSRQQKFFTDIDNGNLISVNLLLEKQADISSLAKSEDQFGLLLAATKGYLGIVTRLLQADCNITTTEKSFTRSILLATANGHLDIVNLLLTKTTKTKKLYFSIFNIAAEYGFLEIITALMSQQQSGFNMHDVLIDNNHSAIRLAASNNHEHVVLYLWKQYSKQEQEVFPEYFLQVNHIVKGTPILSTKVMPETPTAFTPRFSCFDSIRATGYHIASFFTNSTPRKTPTL